MQFISYSEMLRDFAHSGSFRHIISKASCIAYILAFRIFILSIVSWLTTPIPQQAFSFITSSARSRFFSESFFESFSISTGKSSGKMTAPAVTGPAKGPLPASSRPHRKICFIKSLLQNYLNIQGNDFSCRCKLQCRFRSGSLNLLKNYFL